MSSISNKVYGFIKEIFPLNTVLKEHYVPYKGVRLFFDFYIKDLGILIEVQGEQHARYIKHFHGDKQKFIEQKNRDNLKVEYAHERGISFARFYFNEKITEELVLKKILCALEEGFYE